MANIAGALDETIRAAGLPLVSVRIGKLDDKTTWSAQLAENATAQQLTAAQAIIDNFDANTPTAADADKSAFANQVTAGLAQIATDLAAIDGATNAQVRDMLKRAIQRQERIIKYLRRP